MSELIIKHPVQDIEQLAAGWDEGKKYHSKNLCGILDGFLVKSTHDTDVISVSSIVISGWNFPHKSQEHLRKIASILVNGSVDISGKQFIPYFCRTDSVKPSDVPIDDKIFSWCYFNLPKEYVIKILEQTYARVNNFVANTEFRNWKEVLVPLTVLRGLHIYHPQLAKRNVDGEALIRKSIKNAYHYYATKGPYELPSMQ